MFRDRLENFKAGVRSAPLCGADQDIAKGGGEGNGGRYRFIHTASPSRNLSVPVSDSEGRGKES
jgi:hypothetical protein